MMTYPTKETSLRPLYPAIFFGRIPGQLGIGQIPRQKRPDIGDGSQPRIRPFASVYDCFLSRYLAVFASVSGQTQHPTVPRYLSKLGIRPVLPRYPAVCLGIWPNSLSSQIPSLVGRVKPAFHILVYRGLIAYPTTTPYWALESFG